LGVARQIGAPLIVTTMTPGPDATPATPPTMSDVARACSVSVMTVSRALRRDEGVSAATARRVRAVARRLGYRPNPMVSALMHLRDGRRRAAGTVIAYVAPTWGRKDWGKELWLKQLESGARLRAEAAGFRLERFDLGAGAGAVRTLNRILAARGIRGVVIAPFPEPHAQLGLEWAHLAAAAVGSTLEAPSLHRVKNHQYHTAGLAVRHLRAAGCRRIGLAVSRAETERVENLWLAGFLYAHEAVEAVDPALIHRPAEMDPEALRAWWQAVRPDAVVVQRPETARVLAGLGARLALLNWKPNRHGWSGVDQNWRRIGAAAADLIIEQLLRNETGLPDSPKEVLIEGVWHEGRAETARQAPIRKAKTLE
jgi:LacI family transcriptional regulator